MKNQSTNVRMEEVDWLGVFPWLCLLRSFRAAVAPSKLLPALALVVLVYLGSLALDNISGAKAVPQAIGFAIEAPVAGLSDSEMGVLEATSRVTLDAFRRMAQAAASLDFGFDEIISPAPAIPEQADTVASVLRERPDTVVSVLRQLIERLPKWFLQDHPWMLVTSLIGGLVLWSLFGGLIARRAALDAAGSDSGVDLTAPAGGATGFALSRFGRFFVTPLFPLILVVVMAAVLAVGGFVFFNLPGLDMLGGLLFVFALLLGFAIVMVLLLTAAGGSLLYPAIAVDDSDTFDAVSRALGYVLSRPWRWLFYTVLATVYGAVTYIFVGLVLFWTVWATQYFVQSCVIADVLGANRFDLILPKPELATLAHDLQSEDLGWSGRTAAVIVWFWVAMARSLLLAYAVSFYVTASTRIYLLLRRAKDGNEMNDVYLGQAEPNAAFTNNSDQQ